MGCTRVGVRVPGGVFGVLGVPEPNTETVPTYKKLSNLSQYRSILCSCNKKEDHLIQMILLVLSQYLQRFLSGRAIPSTATDFQCSPSHCIELLW